MILLLGTTLTIIGVQIFFLLRDIRQNLKKLSLILDDFEKVTGGVASGAEQFGDLLEKLKGTLSIVAIGKSLWQLFKGSEEFEEETE